MKTLTIANQKGGVGKSAIACQLTYYIALKLGKSILFIDFDHQQNSTNRFKEGKIAEISSVESNKILTDSHVELEDSNFLVLSGNYDILIDLEKAGEEKRDTYVQNLYQFIQDNSENFDYCIIDTNPSPDIRQLSALMTSDFLLSPIQPNSEALEGLSRLLTHPEIGLKNIQENVNTGLEFIGLLPNLHDLKKVRQNEKLKELIETYPDLMIKVGRKFPSIKNRAALSDAQDEGIPIWMLSKGRGRIHWSEIKPIFDKIIKKMGAK
jgi:chromosome partitioning protein